VDERDLRPGGGIGDGEIRRDAPRRQHIGGGSAGKHATFAIRVARW
jgi:hypothetical protein